MGGLQPPVKGSRPLSSKGERGKGKEEGGDKADGGGYDGTADGSEARYLEGEEGMGK